MKIEDPFLPTLKRPMSPFFLSSLRKNGFFHAKFSEVAMLIRSKWLRALTSEQWENTEERYLVSDDGSVSALSWKIDINSKPWIQRLSKLIGLNEWDSLVGMVRNQHDHLLCWIYAVTDLISAALHRSGITSEFVPLCPHVICINAWPQMYEKGDPRAYPGHKCYGAPMPYCMNFMFLYGAPRQFYAVFDCAIDHPKVSPPPTSYKISGWDEFLTLEEALARLVHEPVAANIVIFRSLWSCVGTEDVYRGPFNCCQDDSFGGYHSAVMTGLELLKGEWVVRCKLSQGSDAESDGFVFVSLAIVLYMIGARPGVGVKHSDEPQHLLCDFTIPKL